MERIGVQEKIYVNDILDNNLSYDIDKKYVNLFEKKFPERMFDVGIAEQHAVTFAAGLATEGYSLLQQFTQHFYKEHMIK